MDRLDIPLVGDAAHDPQTSVQPPAVHGQVDVHRIVVGGEQHRRNAMDAGEFDQVPIGGVSRKDRIDDWRERVEHLDIAVERVDGHRLPLE